MTPRFPIIILATVALAGGAGLGIGRYVVPDESKGASGECLILKKDLQDLTYQGAGRGDRSAQGLVDRYDENCR